MNIDWAHVLETALTVVMIPLMAWNVKTLVEVRTALFGIDGKNGMNSRVKDLENTSDNHETRLTIIETRGHA